MVRNSRWLKETSHEAYAKNYSMVFPHDEQLAGRNIRKDVLHQVALKSTIVFNALEVNFQMKFRYLIAYILWNFIRIYLSVWKVAFLFEYTIYHFKVKNIF